MKIDRTSAGLAKVLFDELEALSKGTSTPQQAREKARIANSIISLSRLQLDYARFATNEKIEALKTKSTNELPVLGFGGKDNDNE